MTWRIIDDTPGHYHLICSCGSKRWVRRWNIDAKRSLQCQTCHLKRVRKTKLNEQHRAQIKASNEAAKVLAERFGVSISLIYKVRKST